MGQPAPLYSAQSPPFVALSESTSGASVLPRRRFDRFLEEAVPHRLRQFDCRFQIRFLLNDRHSLELLLKAIAQHWPTGNLSKVSVSRIPSPMLRIIGW